MSTPEPVPEPVPETECRLECMIREAAVFFACRLLASPSSLPPSRPSRFCIFLRGAETGFRTAKLPEESETPTVGFGTPRTQAAETIVRHNYYNTPILPSSRQTPALGLMTGTGFGFLTSPFIIVCSLNGNGLTSDPIPCSPNPTFESDFVWEADKKVLRSMRSHNYSIRVECFSDAKFRRSDKIGYILLNMKHQAQIVSPTLGTNVTFHWQKLLGVRHDAKSYKPEIYLSLFIAEADADIPSKSPKTPLPVLPAAAKQEENLIVTTDAPSAEGSMAKNSVQVGTPRDTDTQFKLSVGISSVYNLKSFITDTAVAADLRLEFALFGDCFKTNNLSEVQGQVDNESITLTIKSQTNSLVAYFTEFPNLYFLLQSSGQTVAKTPFDMKSFITQDKCENLTCGKISLLNQESKLYLDNGESDCNCYFNISVNLEVERSKVKNPIKPFTVATNRRFEKAGDKASANKNEIRGISCKTKTNSDVQPEEIVDTGAKDDVKSTPSVQETELSKPHDPNMNDIQPNTRQNVNPVEGKGFNQVENMQNWPNQMKNMMDQQNFNPNSQCLPQFVYPYFQPNFNFPQDGRGDCEMLGQQRFPGLTEQVKAKITEDLAKKTYEELEEWKEKQKENYKAELKKKLDKEVKRLTIEWLSRQSELEREATTNIEESVSLSQQLHTTSAELKLRLETVTRQQMELEKERGELEKKYSEKHLELREASKKHQANLQQQITTLTSEIGELKAKNCSLTKENEILRGTHNIGEGGDVQTSVRSLINNKSAHLTEQQMTALLVDMKSLEEKLSAALESKEFFRKEWSRALREIHRMKTEQEEQVRLQLQAQRQELDNLRLVGLITADDKASKDDLASLRDLRNQIVRINTPKSS